MAADFALGKTNSLFLVERKDNLFIGGKNNMRKIISLAIAFVMALTLTMSVCAEPYTMGMHRECNDDICGLTGDHVNQVSRTCKKCHTRTVTVYCAGGNYPRPDAVCYYGTHTQPCNIINRLAGVADAYCVYCGSYYYDAYEFRIGDYDGHIDSCFHTSTGETYNTCNYGPRA